ncbi:MAG TPA: hypothetical protein VGU46_03980 [Acidobacteriaceae bacterium]|nr:hypothetical protein [Acidobacteriaceae bacterium]
MLYLNPPYFVIDGVSVFPDDSDPLQFYYLPMMPHLTMVTDQSTNVSTPQMQLIEYEGAAGSGGFLNFDVNLGPDEGLLTEVTNQLQRQMKLTSAPRLSPVLFTDGTVKLVLLGAQSADTAPAAAGSSTSGQTSATSASPTAVTSTIAPVASGPQFVVKIQNAAKPALYGNNQATFSVQLDQYGATILQQALMGQMAPIAVIYSLQFLGLRPAFKVTLTADWNRVQTYLDQEYSGGFLFFSSQIEKTVDKLIEQKVINIQESTFVLEGDLGAGGTTDRDQAMQECYELVKTNFFESSLQPPTPGKQDSFPDDVRNISNIALTGGAAAVASFSYRSVDLTRTDNKMLNFTVSERTSVLRTIYPQGHLAGLLDEVKNKGFKPSDFILRVDLDNPYFTRRKVTVITHADFVTDSIGSIDVTLTYNDVTKGQSLTSGASTFEVDWTSLLANNVVQRPVTYSYTVNFQNVDTTQRPGRLVTGQLTTSQDVLDIEPRVDLYQMTTVPIRAFTLPWDRYSSVEIECIYEDQANGINLRPTAVLTSQATEIDWTLFMQDPTKRSFNYRLTYAPVSGGVIITPWVTTSDAKIDVVDPYPDKINLAITAAVDWTKCAQVMVFAAYPSKQSPVVQRTYVLNQATPSAPPFIAERKDATANLVYFEARIIHTNGSVWTIPGSVTSDAFLILQDGMLGHQVISITSEQADYSSLNIAGVDVSLRYVDAVNHINATEMVTLSSAADVRSFAYDYSSENISAEYSVAIRLENNQTRSVDWTPISGNNIVVPISQAMGNS